MADLAQHFRATRIIAVAMIVSLLVYVVIVELIRTRFEPFDGFSRFPQWETLRWVFLVVAAAEAVGIRFLRAALLAPRPSGPGPGQRLQTASIATFALCESVGLLGFVLFVVSGSSADFYVFLVLSLLLFGIYFPRWDRWEEWSRQVAR